VHFPPQSAGGGIIAIGETPESVRVGDLRSDWRMAEFECVAGMEWRISEFLRKDMPYFSEREFFRRGRLLLGFFSRIFAASFAAFFRSKSRAEESFFISWENSGILPSFFWISAAAYALLAEFFFKDTIAP
jgi:hypothetical protein